MRQTQHGFSLIELLVVISVTAVLMSMLMAATTVAREATRSLTCKNNLRQLGIGFLTYTEDQRGRWPSGSWNPLLEDQLGGYGSAMRVGYCPAAPLSTYAYTGVYYDSITNDSWNNAQAQALQYPCGWAWWIWRQVPIINQRIVLRTTKIVLSESSGIWSANLLNDRGARKMHRQGGNVLCADGRAQLIPLTGVARFAFSNGSVPAGFKADSCFRPYNPAASAFLQ